MAAILEPQRFPRPAAPTRPDLRLIPGGRSTAPTRTGPAPVAVAAALVAVVLLVVATLAVGRGALAGLAPAPATAEAPATASGRTVVVAPGDTLWSIARRLQPTGDVRPLVDRLAAANGGAAIAAGDRLVVPA
ncbi:MAG: LysM peptidoglycan-binding domain-containing protein [Actinobacteria bacterium]|nr:LysM peptidoglycan-binding domain-containing protein [Actinomycetota bacterium]